jgi:rhodanese-related sulfurtransferase
MNVKRLALGVAFGAVGVAIIAGLLIPKGGALPASGEITNAQLNGLVAKGARLIDVRTPVEFGAGHIQGAQNVPVESVVGSAGSWAKDAPVVLYCQTGARSSNAYGYLVAQGFTRVYNLTRGVTAWDGALVQGDSAPSAQAPATAVPTMYDFSTDT